MCRLCNIISLGFMTVVLGAYHAALSGCDACVDGPAGSLGVVVHGYGCLQNCLPGRPGSSLQPYSEVPVVTQRSAHAAVMHSCIALSTCPLVLPTLPALQVFGLPLVEFCLWLGDEARCLTPEHCTFVAWFITSPSLPVRLVKPWWHHMCTLGRGVQLQAGSAASCCTHTSVIILLMTTSCWQAVLCL